MRSIFPISVLVFTTLAIFSSCTDKNASAVIQDKQEYSITDQRVIGDHLAEFMKTSDKDFNVLNANAYPEAYEYLDMMMKAAVVTEQVALREDFNWEIIPVVNNQDKFAYSMPGGKVVISTAMLQYLQSESELLALLSSEIYFTDVDIHTAALRDEFSGIRLGSLALGNADESTDLIEFLEKQIIEEDHVMLSDLRTVAVMCPFNYNANSLKELILRIKSNKTMQTWNERRPRPEDWEDQYQQQMSRCESTSTENFRSRYQEFQDKLPG